MDTRRADPRPIKEVLHEYCSTQAALLQAIKCANPHSRDWEYLTDVPNEGELIVKGTRWRYLVHGTGVRFVDADSGMLVNCHVGLTHRSDVFDAGRIAEYLASKQIQEVLVSGELRPFDFHTGPTILRELAAAGEIAPYEHLPGESYCLGSDCC